MDIANEGIKAAENNGNNYVSLILTYVKAYCLGALGRIEEAIDCFSFVESHIDPTIKFDGHDNYVKNECQEYIKELTAAIKEPSITCKDSPIMTDIEQEYVEMYKEYTPDGEISERERKMLDKFRVRCGISEDRARELEESCNKPQLTDEEKAYLNEVKAILEDGEIGPRERKTLERRRISLGISEERAKEIEKL